MKPSIIKKYDDLVEYTNDTYDAVLQVGATRLQSLTFTLTITAGQTEATFPTDNFDINTDTVLIDLNTRNGSNDAVITQSVGQRAKITVPIFVQDTVVTCVIFKNTVVAKNDMSVNGNVIKVNTLPSDRILAISETVDGLMLKRNTVNSLSINKTDLNVYYSAYNGTFPTVTTYKNKLGQKLMEDVFTNPNANGKYQTCTVSFFRPGEVTRYAYVVGTYSYTGTVLDSIVWANIVNI